MHLLVRKHCQCWKTELTDSFGLCFWKMRWCTKTKMNTFQSAVFTDRQTKVKSEDVSSVVRQLCKQCNASCRIVILILISSLYLNSTVGKLSLQFWDMLCQIWSSNSSVSVTHLQTHAVEATIHIRRWAAKRLSHGWCCEPLAKQRSQLLIGNIQARTTTSCTQKGRYQKQFC